MILRSLLLVLTFICFGAPAAAKSSGGRSGGHAHATRSTRSPAPRQAKATPTPKARCASCARTSSGRIQRSSTARASFHRANPCPSTGKTSGGCPGYVIDHRKALKRGGEDHPSNMQWQTKAAAAAKDRVE